MGNDICEMCGGVGYFSMGARTINCLDCKKYKDPLPSIPQDSKDRKAIPIGTGVLDYFPLALIEVAKVSKAGNDQHNPGQPLHWDKSKSSDHFDCMIRHSMQRGTFDTDGMRHSAKVAWRALALLQEEIEKENNQERDETWGSTKNYDPITNITKRVDKR